MSAHPVNVNKKRTIKVSEQNWPQKKSKDMDDQRNGAFEVENAAGEDKMSIEEAFIYKMSTPNCLTNFMVKCPCLLIVIAFVLLFVMAFVV